jgi:TRAP-type mannitol/chloroaromatic compound transport system permease small subunit/uncharacterized RDD family membrane protein YckC
MSEQSVAAPTDDVFVGMPGIQVPRLSRIIGALSDFVLLVALTAFGAFVGLFIEDALVHIRVLQPMEGLKHGPYGTQFMWVGASIGFAYIAIRNVLLMMNSGQTIIGKLMQMRVVDMTGETAGFGKGFILRIAVPVAVLFGLTIFMDRVDIALIIGAVLVLFCLLAGRTLHDVATGTQVVWADDVGAMPSTIHLSEALKRYVDAVGRFGSWFIIPVVIITCFDVVARKAVWTNSEGIRVGVQIWLVENMGRFFDSTLLQEMEWHAHTILFAFVLGYGYIHNSHVRVDLLRERFDFRTKAKLEFIGLTFFLVPYCLIVSYFAIGYAVDSYTISEISASQVGLPMRWAIKTLLTFGLFTVVAAGMAVWLQVVVALWGPRDLRFPLMTIEWPEEEGSKIEGKERLDLTKVDDELEKRARESGHLVEDSLKSKT